MQVSFAQEKTVSGTVSDATGPLPGVSILVKGTAKGTETDFDGKYSIVVKPGDVLSLSYVGYKTVEKTVGTSNIINVTLEEDASVLEEIVVTAQGIRKEKKAIGYAVSSVKSEQIEGRPTTDVAQALNGQVAGVDIMAGGSVAGAGANITIRGFSSITGNNQPLLVVDGVPVSSSANRQNNFNSAQGASSGSRLSDIDQNNIESIEVLKGLSATVLYGELGRNGVILITTKTGSAGVNKNSKASVSVTSSLFFSEITGLPKWQNTFGNGWQGSASKAFSNWGARFDEVSTVPHIYANNSYQSSQGGGSFNDFFPEFVGADYEYKPYDNVEGFFRTGVSMINSVNMTGGNNKSKFSVSYTNNETEGITPGNQITRDNLSVGGSANLDNGLKISGSVNFIKSLLETPPTAASYGSNASGGSSSVFANVMYTPRSVNLNGLPWEDSLNRSVYYRSNNSIQNPYWTVNNEKYSEDTDRVQGNVTLNYPISDNLNVMWRTGFDSYTLENTFAVNKGGINYDGLGLFTKTFIRERIFDNTLIISGSVDITDDIALDFSAGANGYKSTYESLAASYSDQLIYGKFFVGNFVNKNAGSFYGETVNKLGLFSQLNFSYRNFLYVNLVGRNDWASTHETGNNSLFYPGASVSFLPMTAFDIDTNGAINFLKVRGSFGSSARFAGAYRTRDVLNIGTNIWLNNSAGGSIINTNSVSNRIGNPNLRPELQTEIEFGLEGKFLNNRLSADISWYKRNAKDQIISRDLDPSSGATITLTNAGELETVGLEILLSGTPIQTDDFSWNTTINYSAYESTIVDLPEDIDQIYLNGFSNQGNFAKQGQPMNVLMGTYVERDADGNKIVLDNGFWKVSNDIGVIGDPNPDFTMSFINGFKYKNVNLGFQVDFQKGGDIISYSAATLLARGLTADTDVDRGLPLVLDGVSQNGSPNTTQITLTDYYFDNYLYGADEALVYDATHIRLREVSLTYDLPAKKLAKTPFSQISLSLVANNLWRKAFNFPDAHQGFDPQVSSLGVSNSRGLDYMAGPATKQFGFTLRAKF